jgi:hypothetical protein
MPQIVANDRGDALAVWNGSGTPGPGSLFPDRVDMAQHPAGGDWSAPVRIDRGGSPMRATAAINARGDAVVAWSGGQDVTTSFRPAGDAFGPAFFAPVRDGAIDEMPLALDALGVTLAVRRVETQGSEHIAALLRRRDARPETDVTVSPPGIPVNVPTVATDPFGNGVVVWSAVGNANGAIEAATYSALAPAVDELRVGAREFRFRASEPANVRLTVRNARGRSATQTTVARPAANHIAFAARVRRLLRAKGRYTVTVRTRDAGPTTGTLRFRIRRR